MKSHSVHREHASPLPAPESEELRILIVDDSEPDLIALARLVRRTFGSATQLFQAEDGAEALEILRKQQVDVAFVDYLLPDMDGMELLSAIREASGTTATILLTGQGSETLAAEAIKSGAREYLVKRDLNTTTLSRVVSSAISVARRDEEHARTVIRLERSHAELDHFVRALSHDMSAHFMLLEHSFERLRRSCNEAPRPQMSEAVVHLEVCLRESKRYLDDLQALSQTGSVQMEPSRVSLEKAVREVFAEQSDLLESRRVQVVIEPGLPELWCNETRVKQILTNLIRNAVKHGCDRHLPRISIGPAASPAGSNAGQAWIRVHDNGPGIPTASRDEIFLPGKRLVGCSPDGTGMGLAIVQKIVEHYGGRVFVDPACRQGTAFAFSLPRATGHRQDLAHGKPVDHNRTAPVSPLRRIGGIAASQDFKA